MDNQSKIAKYIEIDEMPTFFRELADAIEKGAEGEFACANDFMKLNIKAKNEFGKIFIKAKFKSAAECLAPADMQQAIGEDGQPIPAKPIYASLKKRMKSSFKMIVKMIHEGQVPPAEAVTSFLEDSALMCTYPGYGDEYYEDYLKLCEDFKKAYAAGDLTAMSEAVKGLAHEKSRCHAKYD